MLCTFCGTENSLENKFCGMCGVKLERRKMERRVRHGTASLKCASCGHISEPGNTFCGMCGARIERRLGDRRGSEERATAIANVQLPSPEVPGKEGATEQKQTAPKPVAETAVEAVPESESATAALPVEEIPGRPPAAIFRSAPAERPAPAQRSAPAKRSAIAGPSFLGLNDDPPGSGDYLLEEEKSSGSVGRILVFVVIAAALGFAAFHWRSNIRGLLKLDGPSKAVPVATPAEEQKPKPETSPAPETAATPSVPEPSPSPAASRNDKTGQDEPDTTKSSAAVTTDSPADKNKTDDASPRPANKNKTEDASSSATKSTAKKDKPREEPSLQPSPALLKAQDYLQGRNGVQQNCEQGLTYLRAAVQRSEPAAAMQMGELYASGHCVQQDRVTAYRWMNSAREKAPGNTAIQTTLDTLWGRMTPQERKEAGR